MIAALTVALTGVVTVSGPKNNARDRTEAANARIRILVNDETYSSAAYDTRLKMALELTGELEAEEMIRNVFYDEHSKMITFEFADGTLGGIMLKDLRTPDGFMPMN
ncbi:MAG: hypothetical protein Q4G19_04335 [Clostridia bacterium]|nr:hypothetical protein [Clostridia bacterium]